MIDDAQAQCLEVLNAVRSWIPTLARCGHIATGIIYLLVGGTTLKASFDVRSVPLASDAALRHTFTGSLGVLVLATLALGLAADCAWQVFRAFSNIETGRSLGDVADRIGWMVSGLLHLTLAVAAAALALGVTPPTADASVQAWARSAMAVRFGPWLVGSVGVTLTLIGTAMSWRGSATDLHDPRLSLAQVSAVSLMMIKWAWAFALMTRGLVLALAGALLVSAAVHLRPDEARGLGGTLQLVQYRAYGTPLLALVGVGFLCNGVLELVRARYRRIGTAAGV